MIGIHDLPPEILEGVLLELDPLDVSTFSQTCREHHTFTSPANQLFWRKLYLAMDLDDPRTCITPLGHSLPEPDWCVRLQRIVRARTVVLHPERCRIEERPEVLRTLLDLICNIPPSTSPTGDDISLNLGYVAVWMRESNFLENHNWVLSPEEKQLLARLHTYYGLTAQDFMKYRLVESRSFVYALRNYIEGNHWGPFMPDGSGKVNWEHIRYIQHVMSMQITPQPEESDAHTGTIMFHMSLPFVQSILPKHIDLDSTPDWADVEGEWQCAFSFCDHRELLFYNDFSSNSDGHYHSELFEDENFDENFRMISVDLIVTSIENDPYHPGRPRIRFTGSIDGETYMYGWVRLTPDNEVRWHFVSGEPRNYLWSSEGVQVGNVRSMYGILGTWTTTTHDPQDPVGPFWMRKVPVLERSETT